MQGRSFVERGQVYGRSVAEAETGKDQGRSRARASFIEIAYRPTSVQSLTTITITLKKGSSFTIMCQGQAELRSARRSAFSPEASILKATLAADIGNGYSRLPLERLRLILTISYAFPSTFFFLFYVVAMITFDSR